jgi:hypothetical protein
VDLPKNRITLVAGIAVAGILTVALATVVWPALVRPEPPLEKAGDDGLRIRVVEPPRAATKPSSPLDVGLSNVAQAVTRGGEALFVRTPPIRPLSPPTRPRAAPVEIAQADDAEDPSRMSEPEDVEWRRQTGRREAFEQTRQRRWEEQRLAHEAQEERAAWEQEAIDRRRQAEARDYDRYENRYPSTPDEDRGPRPERW